MLTLRDPEASLRPEELLDTVSELRDAGAEAIMVNGVRLVAASAVTGVEGAVVVDGRAVVAPYVFTALGEPRTLAEAMDIPGGVIDAVTARPGATAVVSQRPSLVVDVLRPLSTPRYARPAADQDGS